MLANPRDVQAQVAALQLRDIAPTDFTTLLELDVEVPREGEDLLQMKAMVDLAKHVTDEGTCGICMNNQSNRKLPCGHSFCEECLVQAWGKVNSKGGHCPNCRKDVSLELNLAQLQIESTERVHTNTLSSGSLFVRPEARRQVDQIVEQATERLDMMMPPPATDAVAVPSSGVAGMKRALVDADIGLVKLSSEKYKAPVLLCAEHYSSCTGSFDFWAIVTKGKALVGIVPQNGNLSDVAFNDARAPKCGYFIKVVSPHGALFGDGLELFGQDGTSQKPSQLPTSADRVRLRLDTNAAPSLTATISESEDARLDELKFNAPIPGDTYAPCIVLSKNSEVVVSGVGSCSNKKQRFEQAAHAKQLLTSLWESKVFADGLIVCEGRSFAVHRSILVTLSPVFAASFGNGMAESTSKIIHMVDASEKGLHEFLRYAYTGVFEDEAAYLVLPLAVKYQVPALAKRSAELILNEISADNASQLMPALRTHRTDDSVASVWEELVYKVQKDEKMVRFLLD